MLICATFTKGTLEFFHFTVPMKISKKLIEKYHDGICSAEEKQAVESWLLSDEASDQLMLPEEIKLLHSEQMWNEIAGVLPGDERKNEKPFRVTHALPLWRKAVAAAAIVAMFGLGFYAFKQSSGPGEIIVMNNASATINKELNGKEYTISIGPKSNIEINSQTGMIDFCGAMMINPKRDIELTIQGTCPTATDRSEKMKLKKGLNYIALNYGGTESEVIVVEEGSMMGLPPIVMKQLLNQFEI